MGKGSPRRGALIFRVPFLTLVLIWSLPPQARSQTAETGFHPFALETRTEARWLHGRQNPLFSVPVQSTTRIFVDSLVLGPPPARRTFFLSLDRQGSGDKLTLRLDQAGKILDERVTLRPRQFRSFSSPADSARTERIRYFLRGGTEQGILSLPEARGWMMAPVLPPDGLAGKQSWTDTLRLQAFQGGFRQHLTGIRRTRILGDTLVDGQQLWILGDSAEIRISERWLAEERTLGADITTEREGAGILIGEGIFDPASGIFRFRRDSMEVHGKATLRYPDGRTFETPATFRQTRTTAAYDRPTYTVWNEAQQRERRDRGVGVIRFPNTVWEKRIADGDTIFRDSVMAEGLASTDPRKRQELLSLVTLWGSPSDSLRARLDEARLEAGDTAWWAGELARRLWWTPLGLDAETLAFLGPFMEDPGRAWAFGLKRDPWYENLLGHLLRHPPAAMPDTSSWPCTLEACLTLAEYWPGATDPRLRGLGLVARFVLDPGRWADTVRAEARRNPGFLGPALDLVNGVGSTGGPSSSRRPLPGTEAGWREWWEWADGRPAGSPSPLSFESPGPRIAENIGTAIRTHMTITGRPVLDELRRRAANAETDSARLVFQSILLGMEELVPDPSEVARLFQSGKPTDRILASRMLGPLFREKVPADAVTALEILDRVLAFELEGEALWPHLPSLEKRHDPESLYGPQAAPGTPAFVLAEELPAELMGRWAGRAEFISTEGWRARSDRAAGVILSLGPVHQVGAFIRVTLSVDGRQAREEHQSPSGWASWATIYLLKTERGWVEVGRTVAIT